MCLFRIAFSLAVLRFFARMDLMMLAMRLPRAWVKTSRILRRYFTAQNSRLL